MNPLDTAATEGLLFGTLLVKLCIVTAIASVLIRSARFRQIVFATTRTLRERIMFGAYIGIPVMIGVMMRTQFFYATPDLGVEGALLAGVLGGSLCGITAGVLAALPTLFSRVGPSEWLTLPVLIGVGVAGDALGRLAPSVEHIWHFSPFIDMNFYRWVRRRFGKPRGEWQLMFFLMIVVVESFTMLLAHNFPGHRLFALHHPAKPLLVVIVAGGIACISVPIRIWNNTRNELMLEEHKHLLAEARMEALTRQMNPHFLFNTLNSISSLVRTDPELARKLIQKLSNIMRRMLRRTDAMTALRDELDFVDDYLGIERVRFGEKLQVVRDVEEAALDAQVPSMLLQPLVENCIKHGIAPNVDGGTIHIRGSYEDGRLTLEVRDDGQGIPPEKIGWIFDDGVGLSNVRERIKMLYGEDYQFRVTSQFGEGTTVRIVLPDKT